MTSRLLVLAAFLGRASADAPAPARPILYPSYSEVLQRLRALAADYPDLVEIYSAQQRYGVPPASNSCTVDSKPDQPCEQWFVSITNKTLGAATRASGSPELRDRPQFFSSGNLHGNEWVGPVTMLELAEMLVRSATGRGAPYNAWLARLVNTRVIVLLPVSNPYGYDRQSREDFNGLDPNRDFSYDREEINLTDHTFDTNCMATTIGRAINEDFRAHLYQVAVTFHGGMQEVSWEWGSFGHQFTAGARCPDDVASELLGDTMRDYAGGLQVPGSSQKQYYPAGRIDPDVYPVYGGMEDWAYGGERRARARGLCLSTATQLTLTPLRPSSVVGLCRHKEDQGAARLARHRVRVRSGWRLRPRPSAVPDAAVPPRQVGPRRRLAPRRHVPHRGVGRQDPERDAPGHP